MKVAIIADALDNQRAGVHVYLREVLNALASNPGEHEYILIRQRKDPTLPFRQIVVPSTRLPIGYASFRLFVVIPWILRKLRPDVVFEPAHFGPFNLPRRIKRVTMIHDLTPILFPRYHPWYSQMLQRLFLPGILKRADLILSNSENTSGDLHRVYPFTKGKVKTILLGRDQSFKPDHGDEFRKAFNIQGRYFLYVGTLEPRKNLPVLLDAYRRFRNSRNDDGLGPEGQVQLILVGQRGWKNGAFDRALDGHPYRNDITLTGYVPKQQLLQAYTGATAMIYPSRYEGFGFPILEAMACGTVVICPHNSSLPEVGGDVALYYDTDDAENLAKLLVSVAAGKLSTADIVERGRDRAVQFSWKKYARAFDRAIDSLGTGTTG